MTHADAATTDPSTRPVRLLVTGAVATVVIGFVVGFLIGGRGTGRPDGTVTASGDRLATTSTGVPPTSTADPAETPTSTSTSTSVSSTSTTTESTTTTDAVPSTVLATTTAPPVVSVAPTTAPAVTTVPPTFAPSRVVVSYARDGAGRLVVPRYGSATVVIANEGGLAQQWLVTGSGFSTAGPTQGHLAPGQSVAVSILAPREELPLGEINGIISVLGAIEPTVAFVIPAA